MFVFPDELKYKCVPVNVAKLKPSRKLRIRLISGHHLPKIDGKIKGNVIQPYVRIKVRGHTIDEHEYTTQVVPKVRVLCYIAINAQWSSSLGRGCQNCSERFRRLFNRYVPLYGKK